MIRALLKKQMMEVFSWLYQDRKSGKHRTGKGVLGYALLYLLLFGFLGVIFGNVANFLCPPLLKVGMGWLYWCLMGLIAIFMGVFGSVFNTYSTLYQTKDNDLLLSMPIPVSSILLVRLSGVYAMGLLYECLVMIPAMIIWLVKAPFTIIGTVNVILIPLVLSFFILVLSAILGWVVAVVMTKVKHKNMITVVLSLAFIVAYYYVYGKAYSLLQNLLVNAEEFGKKVQNPLYPFYHMGLAAEGKMGSMLIFTGIVAILVALVVWILSHNFLKLATGQQGVAKVVYKRQKIKKTSVSVALIRKERMRFTGSANYMLNCGLGILLMPLAGILLFWKGNDIRPLLGFFPAELVALGGIAALCMLISMNDMSAPSISLEGKSLWILQMLPVSGKQVLLAKLKLHLLLTLIPAVVPVVAVEWLLGPTIFYGIAIPVVTILFALFMAMLGLFCNLLMPNLQWSNEVIPIKQSVPVTIALLGGWMIVGVLAVGYYFLRNAVTASAFLGCVMGLLLIADVLLLRWLTSKGAERFENL